MIKFILKYLHNLVSLHSVWNTLYTAVQAAQRFLINLLFFMLVGKESTGQMDNGQIFCFSVLTLYPVI